MKKKRIELKGDTQIRREINALSELLSTAPKQFVKQVADRMLELLALKDGEEPEPPEPEEEGSSVSSNSVSCDEIAEEESSLDSEEDSPLDYG